MAVQQRLPSLLDDRSCSPTAGARAHAPENTLEAFALALRLGATGLESDVWLTADGVPVLDHDGAGADRGAAAGRSRSCRRDELPGHIPTLADLLAVVGTRRRRHLSLDLKDAGAGRRRHRARSAATRPRHARPPVAVPPDLDLLTAPARPRRRRAAGRLDPPAPAPGRARNAGPPTSPRRRSTRINLHHTDWNGGLVTLFHRFERVAFGWDLQFEHVLRPALRMGLDGVFSDHVDVMVDAYRAELGAP